MDMTSPLALVLPSTETALRLLLVFLASLLVKQALARAGRPSPYRRLATRIAFPLSVLALTYALTLAGEPVGLGAGRNEVPLLLAWDYFWMAVLAIRFLDALPRFLYDRKGAPYPVPILLRRSILAIVYFAVGMMLLRHLLHVEITPFLATSAILSMVVGLALQGVLGNVLAGVSLSLVRTVKIGDHIRVGELEGLVQETNWRETILLTRYRDYVHVPNSHLASETVVNHSRPRQRHVEVFEIITSYADPPGKVIAALEEAARDAPLVGTHIAPAAFLTQFLDFGIQYRLEYETRNVRDRFAASSEVGTIAWHKFKRMGIEIPFPMSDQLLQDLLNGLAEQQRPEPAERDRERIARAFLSCRQLCRLPEGTAGEDSITDPVPFLGREAAWELAGRCRIVSYAPGEFLCRQGERGESCYILLDGGLEGTIEMRGGEAGTRKTFTVRPGDLFGEMALYLEDPLRTATGRFVAESELVEIPREGFAMLLAKHAEIQAEIAEVVAARNRENREFLESIAGLPSACVEKSCDSGTIIACLRRLAGTGARLLGAARGRGDDR